MLQKICEIYIKKKKKKKKKKKILTRKNIDILVNIKSCEIKIKILQSIPILLFLITNLCNRYHRIDGVMVSVLSLNVVDRGFKPKAIKLVFVSSPLSIKEKAKTGWLGISILCGVTCLPADYCFSELALSMLSSRKWTSSSSH